MSRERWNEHIREALAEVEEQRDDAVVYLSAIKVLLDLLARGHAVRQWAGGRRSARAAARPRDLRRRPVRRARRRPDARRLRDPGAAPGRPARRARRVGLARARTPGQAGREPDLL